MQLMNELINHSVFILSIDARECRNADFAKSSKLIRISEERRWLLHDPALFGREYIRNYI